MQNELKNFPIIIQQELIWNDMDAYQHVNNAVYFRYFEDARMQYFEKIGINQYKEAHNLGPILATTTADYKAPLIYPDTINIGARITDIHSKKFSMQYIVYSQKMQKIAATGSALIVYFDYTPRHSCVIPDYIREQIHSFEKS